ncbi:response regulator transcription factor [Paenibacillus sp. JX-17]|uniref:Response regulator transcription factor n=1 Tax=Paenibacillus lacisoli TaxID=3064525 RepID=A0ABT9CAZ5_9BACL|nr:response regulator transcription factor [Paenibacillus sp. JX-17]MDO7906434.1 response regulator transcription factor [Paenibacillus sp. JX-17]
MSSQTNQVKYSISRASIPDSLRTRFASPAPAPEREPLRLVDTCPVTRRVILVSPIPGAVTDLVRTLSDGCYDVLVFHRWEPEVQAQLRGELLIYDMTSARSDSEFAELKSRLAAGGAEDVPCLFLVKEPCMPQGGGAGPREDVLVWPAASAEVLYRVQRMMERRPASMIDSERTVFKDLWIDRGRMMVRQGENLLSLTKTEYDLLLMLVDSRGKVVSREAMLSDIWDTQFMGGSNVVDVHVKSLRKKLGDNAAAPKYITTVRGVGYRLAD